MVWQAIVKEAVKAAAKESTKAIENTGSSNFEKVCGDIGQIAEMPDVDAAQNESVSSLSESIKENSSPLEQIENKNFEADEYSGDCEKIAEKPDIESAQDSSVSALNEDIKERINEWKEGKAPKIDGDGEDKSIKSAGNDPTLISEKDRISEKGRSIENEPTFDGLKKELSDAKSEFEDKYKEIMDKMEKLEAKKETPKESTEKSDQLRPQGKVDMPVERNKETTEAPSKTAKEGTENSNRELTEQEKQKLKEQLGWDNKQIAKCSIDNEGVIHYKTDRSDMDGKVTEQGVKYESKITEINGTKIEGVFPKFNSTFEVQLPKGIEKASNTTQFGECNRQLAQGIEKNPELAKKFTKEQIEDIRAGQTPEGYTWHHNEDQGKMQLVKTVEHDRTQGGAAHTGGKTLWGGGYATSAN